MFKQHNHWNTGVIRHKGRDLEIEVSPPKDAGDEILFLVIALIVVCGCFYLVLSPSPGASSPRDPIALAVLASIFGAFCFFLFRGLAEQQFASQIVSVKADTIQWTRKTRLWKRERNLKLNEVENISATAAWTGIGGVRVTTKRGRHHVVLNRILNEDATRFARQLKTAARDHRT